MPFDKQDVCLDVWEWSDEAGGTIGLWGCKSEDENRSLYLKIKQMEEVTS